MELKVIDQSEIAVLKSWLLIGQWNLRTHFVVLDMDPRTPRGLYIELRAGNLKLKMEMKDQDFLSKLEPGQLFTPYQPQDE